MFKYPENTPVTEAGINKFYKKFISNDQTLEIDLKSEKLSQKALKKNQVSALQIKTVLNQNKKNKKDSVVFLYRSNLKKENKLQKTLWNLNRKLEKDKKKDVQILFYDVDKNAQLMGSHKRKNLPALVVFRNNYDLERTTTLFRANKIKDILLFLNDRLFSDYSEILKVFED